MPLRAAEGTKSATTIKSRTPTEAMAALPFRGTRRASRLARSKFATVVMCSPETDITWERPTVRKSAVSSGEIPEESPMRIPFKRPASSSGKIASTAFPREARNSCIQWEKEAGSCGTTV